ncbi:MAG: hypothetical protein DYG88_15530 [Chloroflexi bacterium CFX4]|nr:hypothetical protein [Chloroflexi bacterium CFX4]MDL1924174.1 hypothetical protein [Chloroflexi bacterium CFX3]
MFNRVLKIAFPKVNTPLFALRVRQLNLTRLESNGILICLAGVALGIYLGFFSQYSWNYNSFINFLIFGAFVLILLGDFLYVFSGLATARRLQHGTQWEELRLTNLSAHDVISAEFAALQMRLWRVMAFECAVRLALIALVITNIVLYTNFGRFNLFIVAVLCLSIAYAICYGMEPLWRMRALSARALLFGTRLRDPILASLLSIAFGIMLHGIVMAAVFGGFMAFWWLSGSAFWGYTSDISVTEFCGFIIVSVVFWIVIRGSHRLLTERALKALAHRFERVESNE